MQVSIPRDILNPRAETPSNLHADSTLPPQDFGIEKHGHKLPPPFYPRGYNAFSASDSLPKVDAVRTQTQDFIEDSQKILNTDELVPNWSLPLCSNITPSGDNLQSPKESLYQGYGQFPHKSLQHEPPVATEILPSPPEAPYEDYAQATSGSCNTSQNLALDSTTPLQYSFYQGYTYGNLQPIFSPHDRSPSPQHSSPRIEHEFDLPANDERKSSTYLSSQTEGERASAPRSTPLSVITHSTVVQSRDSPYGSVHVDDSAGVSGITSESSFRHQASSQSSLGLENDSQQYSDFEAPPKEVSTAKSIEFEVWRSSILESLNETLGTSFIQYGLTDHLLLQFESGAFADCRLELSHKNDKFETTEFLLHSVIISQSPLLKGLLNATPTQEDGIRHLRIQIQDRFVTPVAIQAALRVCYGDPPLAFNGSSYTWFSQSTAELSVSWMENALAFSKAGSLLGLEAVFQRGLQIASKILNWENIETALSFLLVGQADINWWPETIIQSAEFLSLDESVDHESNDVQSLKKELHPVNREMPTEPESPAFNKSNRTHSNTMVDLLYQCLHFIIADFPQDWDLDASSRPVADIDRLPVVPKSRSPLCKSRLSLIQFGDHPSERATKASDVNVVLSSLMLSMPFDFIKYILDRLNESITKKSVKDLVEERERRRRQVLKCDSVSLSARQASVEYGHVGWEEYVNLDQNSHSSIGRNWTGLERHSNIDMPKIRSS